MKKMVFILFVLAVMGFVLFSWMFHLIRTKDGFHIVQKKEASFKNTYLDTTQWGPLDYVKYPHISQALLVDKWQSFKDSTQKSFTHLQKNAEEALEKLTQKLKQSDEASQEIKKLQKKFKLEWLKIQKQINETKDQATLDKLKKDAEKLVQRLKSEIAHLQDEYSSP